MEDFQKMVENRLQYAKDWKTKTGGKILGYLCTYFPEEIVYAAGVLPIRILCQLGEREADDVTERYMYNAFCPLSRCILTQGLKGRYDYLDGLGYGEGCMHMRHVYASWRSHISTPYFYYVSIPSHVGSTNSAKMVRGELSAFGKDLETWTGKNITEESLGHAIEVYNTNRSLMKQIYELRRYDDPPISGAEAMEMVLSSQVMDKEEHNRLLMDVIKNLPQRKDRGNQGARLMLLGSDIHDSSLVRMIESMEATVVVDGLCSGTNYLWNNVVPRSDHLLAIAQRYLDKPRCPLKDVRYRRRVTYISRLIEDYNVQGVMIVIQKFCHPQQFDFPPIKKELNRMQVPFHFIEYDGTIPTGEFQTRIEAFIKTMKSNIPLSKRR